ncbi:hypothetical protein VaNZ11_011349, partial [Volvox africanus]
MHGIRLDSDVEDTPDKRERPQIQHTGGQTFRTNRGSTENDTAQEKTISPGKQLLAVKAVRRSRLRLASKGSASALAPLSGVPHQPPGAVPSLRLTAKEDEASSQQLPSRAQQELAVTPQRPRSLPEWPQRISAKPKAAGASSPHVSDKDRDFPPRASGPQTESPGQHQSKDAPPPPAQAAHDAADDAPPPLPVPTVSADERALGGGVGAAAAAPKKSVHAKLNFFAPHVRRVSKPVMVKVDSDPGIVQIPAAAQPALPPDSVRVHPCNPPQQQQQQQQQQQEEVMTVKEDNEKDLSGSVPQPQEAPAVVALVSEAPRSHDAAQGASAPQNEKGPEPEGVPLTEYVRLSIDAEGTAAEHTAVGGAASTANGTADDAHCAEAAGGSGGTGGGADADACGFPQDTIAQQQQQQPPQPYSGLNGFESWQDHATTGVARRPASRTCRQALLPGALPPSAAAGKVP